jgi:hypothetical protein
MHTIAVVAAGNQLQASHAQAQHNTNTTKVTHLPSSRPPPSKHLSVMSAAVTKVGANIIPKQDPKAHATQHQPHCSSAKRGECNPLAGSLQTNDQPCRLYSLQILQALGGYALVHPQHSQPLHTRSTQS